MDPDIQSDPEKWMERVLEKFNRCPRCGQGNYIIFEGCSNCGYENRFAEHALTAIPGSMASLAAWDTMFSIEIAANEIYRIDAPEFSSQEDIEKELEEKYSSSSQQSSTTNLSSSDEIFDYLLSQREKLRREISEKYTSLKSLYRQSYETLSQSITPNQVLQFTAFNNIEDTALLVHQKALLAQGVLIWLGSLFDMDIDVNQARKASRRFLTVIRADIAEYQDASKDLLKALEEARMSIFYS